ncbi:DNA cytosine methyltransferase [Streptomyces sp. NPDC049590]|uniref:DNA cytosine methyltransferase n=1 Tax=Streptomyces sp. NPDC049590 TaxID=3154834 RepID=UPI003423B117
MSYLESDVEIEHPKRTLSVGRLGREVRDDRPSMGSPYWGRARLRGMRGSMQKFKLVNLFAGVGSWSLAAHHLGVPVVGVECPEGACETRRAAGLATVEEPVQALGPADFPGENVLASHPPAQNLTVAGQGPARAALTQVLDFVDRMTRREDIGPELAQVKDERTRLVLEPLRWALDAVDKDCAYEAIALIHIPSLLPLWEAMGEVLTARGYSVACGLLRAEQYGVPQTRRSSVMIARRGAVARLPLPTHRAYRKGVPREEGDPLLLPWVSMGEALSRPYPFEVISNYGVGGDPRARGRRTSGEPAFMVTGKVGRTRLVTPDGTVLPRLSPSEVGQLQTFPADFPWAGRDVTRQIGNAVPPLLGAHILAAALGLPAPTSTCSRPATS